VLSGSALTLIVCWQEGLPPQKNVQLISMVSLSEQLKEEDTSGNWLDSVHLEKWQ